jgi:hypothetical protein
MLYLDLFSDLIITFVLNYNSIFMILPNSIFLVSPILSTSNKNSENKKKKQLDKYVF